MRNMRYERTDTPLPVFQSFGPSYKNAILHKILIITPWNYTLLPRPRKLPSVGKYGLIYRNFIN